jgi:hypothetical protein
MTQEILTQSELKKILSYNNKTGVFTRKEKTTPFLIVGAVTGYKAKSGYLITTIKNKQFYCHRLAWLYEYGEWPKGQIDHINHNRSDNRICNLRDATVSQNRRNMRLSPNSSTGITGVYVHRNKWTARITVENKLLYLGCFKNKDDAIKARKKAEKKYGFHPNHGL